MRSWRRVTAVTSSKITCMRRSTPRRPISVAVGRRGSTHWRSRTPLAAFSGRGPVPRSRSFGSHARRTVVGHQYAENQRGSFWADDVDQPSSFSRGHTGRGSTHKSPIGRGIGADDEPVCVHDEDRRPVRFEDVLVEGFGPESGRERGFRLMPRLRLGGDPLPDQQGQSEEHDELERLRPERRGLAWTRGVHEPGNRQHRDPADREHAAGQSVVEGGHHDWNHEDRQGGELPRRSRRGRGGRRG